MKATIPHDGNVVDFASFKLARRGIAGLDRVHCPLCDALTDPRDQGDVVAYVCEGADGAHARFQWSHAPDEVTIAS